MSQKEVEKLKYEHTGLDSKLRWHVQKVALDEVAREKAEKKIEELNAEINQLKLADINRAKEEVEIERNLLAEKQLVEVNASMILLKHNNEEKIKRIESLEKNCHQLETELSSLKFKYETMCRENEEMSKNYSSLQQQNNDAQTLLDKQTLKIAELQSNQNDLEIIRTQLSIEKENNRTLKNDLSSLNTQIDEQNEETEKWRIKETELLQINKELTETVVRLKNDCSNSNSKAIAFQNENELIKKDKSYYESAIKNLEQQLDQEIKKRNSDCQLMAKHISEKTKTIDNLQKKIDDLTGELEAQAKKNSNNVKELTREISQLTKKLESAKVERCSSTTSESESSTESNHHNEYPTLSIDPSQKLLIDKVVRLQKEIVRKSEKIDFLENHQVQLVEELKKKSRLLHHYLLREQSGSLLKAKKVPDCSNMTLELAVEINRKLQGTLEDLILKNITLKENIDHLTSGGRK
jgi:chromosome segregation ATPase